MTSTKPPFYITTAIHYPNGEPHIGHAYEVIASDVMARFKRLDGYETYFLTGTDEHGQKIQRAAEAKGVTPKEYVDVIVASFKELWAKLNVAMTRELQPTWTRFVSVLEAELGRKNYENHQLRQNLAFVQGREAAALQQIERVKALKASRDSAAVEQRLGELKRASATDGVNLMPALLDAARDYVTMGEICDAWREVWGTWRETPVF